MAHFRIHRMKDSPQENFRWAAHTGGLAMVKAKDYEMGEEIEAGNPYEIWKRLADAGRALRPGDVLESVDAEQHSSGEMWIVKYIGFEPAQWFVPAPGPVAAQMEASHS
jgi:hypothetical protein